MPAKSAGKSGGWMQKASKSIEKRGTKGVFKAAAKRAKMSTGDYATKVLSPGSKASKVTKARARLAKSFMSAKH